MSHEPPRQIAAAAEVNAEVPTGVHAADRPDVTAHNRAAWDRLVAEGDRWTVPVSAGAIRRARDGDFELLLTPERPVPRRWFDATITDDVSPVRLDGRSVLCLAGGGGQQGPLLAAAGAAVTVFDNSPAQLGQDRHVADREGLDLRTVQGDMADLSTLSDESFDLIVHPCSNCFVPDITPVWREAFRVLRPGGQLMSGFVSPVNFLFDHEDFDAGRFVVKHSVPFSDVDDLPEATRRDYVRRGEAFCFGHTLGDQIGGQTRAGFAIVDFFEDGWDLWPLSRHIATLAATLARKPVER